MQRNLDLQGEDGESIQLSSLAKNVNKCLATSFEKGFCKEKKTPGKAIGSVIVSLDF